MKVWAAWHGGPSYAAPYIPEDLETFDSLKAAANETWRRQETSDPYYPVVEDSEMWVYFRDPTNERDPYPDRIITIGPRGGIRIERT